MTVYISIALWQIGQVVEWDGRQWHVTAMEATRLVEWGERFIPSHRYTLEPEERP